MNYKKQVQYIRLALSKSKTKISLKLKLEIAQQILSLMNRQKKFGMFVILGWEVKWKQYIDTPDDRQDIFGRRQINIMETKLSRKNKKKNNIADTINFDGALLIDRHGNIIHSGVMIEGLQPRAVAHRLNYHSTPDLSSRFGFKKKVHMRHIAAITSSYIFKNTTVFTVSEETGDFHIFENGKIIYST